MTTTRTRITRLAVGVAWLAVLGLLAACSEPPTIVGPSPSSPAPQGLPAPEPNPRTGPALTGVVFQTTEQGRRPVSGARLFVVDLIEGPYGDYGWSEVVERYERAIQTRERISWASCQGHRVQWARLRTLESVAVCPRCVRCIPRSTETTTRTSNWLRPEFCPDVRSHQCCRGLSLNTSEGRRPAADGGALQQLRPRWSRRVHANRRQRPLHLLRPSTRYRVRACRVRRCRDAVPRVPLHQSSGRDTW